MAVLGAMGSRAKNICGAVSGNVEPFQYFNFETDFLRNQKLFSVFWSATF